MHASRDRRHDRRELRVTSSGQLLGGLQNRLINGLALLILSVALWLYSTSAAAQSTVAAGVVYAQEERALSVSASGLLLELHVRQGDTVRDGQTLLQLDYRLQELDVARHRLVVDDTTEARVLSQRLEIIDAQYTVLNELYSARGSISRDELDALRLERIQLRGQLDQVRARKDLETLDYERAREVLRDLSLVAPMDGVVIRIERQPGEWVSAGEPVVYVVDMSAAILKVNLPDQLVRRLSLSQAVVAEVDGVGARQGQVDYIAPVADPASSLVEVHVLLDNADGAIRPGTKAELHVNR